MWFLALRHLVARKKQTIFTLLGIVFGATAFIVISGFFQGFQDFLINQLLNNDAHIRIYAKEDYILEHALDQDFFSKLSHVFWHSPPGGRKDKAKIQDPQGWYKRLAADPRVEAFSPQLTANVIASRAKTSVTGRLIGVIPAKQVKVTNINDYMVEGKFLDIAQGGNRIIVGDELLSKIGGHVGETLLVSSGTTAAKPYKISGSFHIGIKTLDEAVIYGNLSDAQRLNQTPSQVNEIAIRVFDTDAASSMAASWRQIAEEKVKSWDEINANFLNVFKIQNATKYMMIAVILIVAGFGIYNILNMVVTQKRKDIAILRSMGYETSDVVSLFLIQGFILGVIGAVLGMIFGYWICLYLETIPFGGGPLGGSGYLRVSFAGIIYLRAVILSVGCACFASYLPARTAGNMQPIEIIRAGAE